MSKLKDLFKRVWGRLSRLFDKLDDLQKTYVKVAVTVCEELKKAIENGTYDVFATVLDIAIPNDQALIFAEVKKFLQANLPKIISDLQLVSVISHLAEDDTEGQMKAIFDALTNASHEAQIGVWQGLSDKIVELFADGQITRAERRQLIDWYYITYVKNEK